MSFSWNKIKLIFKIVIQIILHPIDSYRIYKFYRDNKDKIKTVVNEIKPMFANIVVHRQRIEEYLAARFKELGVRDELIVVADYLANYLENTDTETLTEIAKEFLPETANIDKVLENLTPADIQHYKIEAINWLKTL